MLWFKKKTDERAKVAEKVSIEVNKHIRDKRQAVAEANRKSESLKQSIRRNGFTLNIHAAAGGKN